MADSKDRPSGKKGASYWRFAAMIATSTVAMYGLMYLNTYAYEHVFWSETRAWMALVMGSTMSVIMLGYMRAMYRKKAVNLAIFGGSVAVFALALWLVRSQATVDDTEYMRAMIPHHSIAILTSERAQITDPRVRKLAEEIIEAQEREISEMKHLVADLEAREWDDNLQAIHAPEIARIVPAAQALEGAHVPTLDPSTMNDAEIRKALADGPRCAFRYTTSGRPVLAFSMQADATAGGTAGGVARRAIVKLNGHLVPLERAVDETGALPAGRLLMFAKPVRILVQLDPGEPHLLSGDIERREASMVFEVGERLRAGYRGYLDCGPELPALATRK